MFAWLKKLFGRKPARIPAGPNPELAEELTFEEEMDRAAQELLKEVFRIGSHVVGRIDDEGNLRMSSEAGEKVIPKAELVEPKNGFEVRASFPLDDAFEQNDEWIKTLVGPSDFSGAGACPHGDGRREHGWSRPTLEDALTFKKILEESGIWGIIVTVKEETTYGNP